MTDIQTTIDRMLSLSKTRYVTVQHEDHHHVKGGKEVLGYRHEHTRKLSQREAELLDTLKAALARFHGIFDDPALESFGPLTDDVALDVAYIMQEGIVRWEQAL